jgi:release factor glutamine methyltransferase
MSVSALIHEKLAFLTKAGIDSSKYELSLLLADVLHCSTSDLHFWQRPLSTEEQRLFDGYVAQRANHCPVDKILGYKGFYKYDFAVSRDVLSPRADTETLVEKALSLIPADQPFKILECGIGSGCILLSLLKERPSACGTGLDISDKALQITRQNAERLEVQNRLTLHLGSWFDTNLAAQLGTDFDLIISNPPYIKSQDIATLDPEVKNFDPLTALDGGTDGLRDYRQIAKQTGKLLKTGGILIFEAGIHQARDIVHIGQNNGLVLIDITKDLNHIDRCITLKKEFAI